VALDPAAPVTAPEGFQVTEVPVNLEDVYLWLSGSVKEVQAP
jgi:hypothetical protein